MSSADLTTRELECLRHAADGLETKEAARVMGLSPWTVKDLRKMVMAKLRAKNMTQAVAIASSSGYFEGATA